LIAVGHLFRDGLLLLNHLQNLLGGGQLAPSFQIVVDNLIIEADLVNAAMTCLQLCLQAEVLLDCFSQFLGQGSIITFGTKDDFYIG
jgi:hypothetical protein